MKFNRILLCGLVAIAAALLRSLHNATSNLIRLLLTVAQAVEFS